MAAIFDPRVVPSTRGSLDLGRLADAIDRHRVVVVHHRAGLDAGLLDGLSRALTVRRTGDRAPARLATSLTQARGMWCTDLSFLERPPAYGVAGLVGTAHPRAHTRWIDTADAYDRLPRATRVLVDDLRALHVHVADEGRTVFQTVHPLVTADPQTGRRSLYLGDAVRGVVGLGERDSAALLAHLHHHLARIEPVVIPWRRGDAVLWDARGAMHDRIDLGARGSVHGAAHAGAIPVGVDGRPSRVRHAPPDLITARAG